MSHYTSGFLPSTSFQPTTRVHIKKALFVDAAMLSFPLLGAIINAFIRRPCHRRTFHTQSLVLQWDKNEHDLNFGSILISHYDELQQQRSSVEGSTIFSTDMLLCCSADACPLKIDTKENT